MICDVIEVFFGDTKTAVEYSDSDFGFEVASLEIQI
jgi:hypothetical protein